MPKLLQFVEKTNPILRETMPDVENFNDPLFHETIKDMCYSIAPNQLKRVKAAHDSAAGMAANQWGIKQRIFIYTPEGSEEEKLLEVMINPSYVPFLRPSDTSPVMVEGYEGCFSVPLTTGLVKRYAAIVATFYNPAGEKVVRIMEGWEARVFQHETDHLNGKLFDGQCDHLPGPECTERIVFQNKAEMNKFWDNKVKESRKK